MSIVLVAFIRILMRIIKLFSFKATIVIPLIMLVNARLENKFLFNN